MKIVAITGSVAGRKTRITLNYVLDYLRFHHSEADLQLINIGDYNLEFSDGRPIHAYNSDTQYVIQSILNADALLVGTPTYQTSIPGALKNVFDLLPMNSLKNHVAGITVNAGSPKYFLMAEQQLKPILSYMGATLVQKYVFVEDCHFEGDFIVDESINKRLETLAIDLLNAVEHMKWCKTHNASSKK